MIWKKHLTLNFSFIFKNYLGGLDSYTGEYSGLKNILNTGIEKMSADLKKATK